MVVRRNFEELYRAEEDPWQIGTADSDRYTTYVEFLRRHAPPSGFSSALDLGCGKGAFTARLVPLARLQFGVVPEETGLFHRLGFLCCGTATCTQQQTNCQ